MRKNDAGEIVPKLDLSSAAKFGEPVVLLDGRASPFNPKQAAHDIAYGLRDMQEQDFLLLVGNPVFIGLASVAAAEHVDNLRFLVWSGKEQRYIIVEESNDD